MSIDVLDLHNQLAEGGWERFTWGGQVGRVHQLRGYSVRIADVHEDEESGPYNGRSSGEASQGWSGSAWIVFEVRDEALLQPRYFKKIGTVSSYYNTSWDGPFVEVQESVRKVKVYE